MLKKDFFFIQLVELSVDERPIINSSLFFYALFADKFKFDCLHVKVVNLIFFIALWVNIV